MQLLLLATRKTSQLACHNSINTKRSFCEKEASNVEKSKACKPCLSNYFPPLCHPQPCTKLLQMTHTLNLALEMTVATVWSVWRNIADVLEICVLELTPCSKPKPLLGCNDVFMPMVAVFCHPFPSVREGNHVFVCFRRTMLWFIT